MKNLLKTIAMAAIASLALAGCIKHDPYGHRPDVDPNGGSPGGGMRLMLMGFRACGRDEPLHRKRSPWPPGILR